MCLYYILYMTLLSSVKEGDLKKVRKILDTTNVSKKELKEAINASKKRREPDNVLNLMNTSTKDNHKVFVKIHNLLTAYYAVKYSRRTSNKENIDGNVMANIANYIGGKRTRKTRKINRRPRLRSKSRSRSRSRKTRRR